MSEDDADDARERQQRGDHEPEGKWLWSGARHRFKGGDPFMVTTTISYIQGQVFSGHAGDRCDPWPRAHKKGFDELIADAWTCCAPLDRWAMSAGRYTVVGPTPVEALQVGWLVRNLFWRRLLTRGQIYESIGSWRATAMNKTKSLVMSRYEFRDDSESCRLATALLANDYFLSDENAEREASDCGLDPEKGLSDREHRNPNSRPSSSVA